MNIPLLVLGAQIRSKRADVDFFNFHLGCGESRFGDFNMEADLYNVSTIVFAKTN